MVERTAHNGLVVGSNPTKLKIKVESIFKIYQKNKTKKYIKSTKLFFFYNGIYKNSDEWILIKQEIKTLNYQYKNMYNKLVCLTLKNSIYFNISSIITGVTFFVKPNNKNQKLTKKTLINKLDSFFLLGIKLNNKIYLIKLLQNINSLDYLDNELILFQCLLTNFKFSLKKFKIEIM